MLRALVFDFDGLIVDTETPAYHAWQELYRRHGQELPLELWAQVIGTHEVRFDAMEHLEKLHGEGLDRDALHADRNVHKTALTDAQPLLPGVRELVEDAGARGIKLGVASSSHHPWVEGHLDRNVHKTALTDAQPLLPGVRELVEDAGARGIKLGVASSSHHPWVEGH